MVAGAGLWPVRCAPVGQVAVGSVLWRHQGALHCTAIVKATFQLPERGLMDRINPTPIARTDDYLHGLPSLAVGCEIAPLIPRVDVTVVGHAYAQQQTTTKRSVRMMVVRGTQVLIDKTLYVYGDRNRQGHLEPFAKMHVGYERALGGLGHPDNPIGIGIDPGSPRSPNVIDPREPDRRVAGFAPIPSRFPQRRKRRGSVPAERIENGIADYPEGFDWTYFQAAPFDQQLPQLYGDEWLMLEGMHRAWPRLHARLPRVRAHCIVYARQNVGAPEIVELAADQVHVEPDRDRCSVVWRGRFAIASELAADQLVLAGAVQLGSEPVYWPQSFAEAERYASPAPAPYEVEGRLEDDLQATAFVARVPGTAQPSLGLGYRLGERRLELGSEPAAEPAAGLQAQPPLVPPSDVPPAPPSYAVLTGLASPGVPRLPADLAAAAGANGTAPAEPQSDLYSTDRMSNPERDAVADAARRGDRTELVELDADDLEPDDSR